MRGTMQRAAANDATALKTISGQNDIGDRPIGIGERLGNLPIRRYGALLATVVLDRAGTYLV